MIFLTRKGSIQPFTQQLPSQELVPLLEAVVDTSNSHLGISSEHAATVSSTLQRVARVKQEGTLLTLTYTTIFEYLQVRRCSAAVLQCCSAAQGL